MRIPVKANDDSGAKRMVIPVKENGLSKWWQSFLSLAFESTQQAAFLCHCSFA